MKEFEVTLTAVSRKTFKLRADSQEDAFLLAEAILENTDLLDFSDEDVVSMDMNCEEQHRADTGYDYLLRLGFSEWFFRPPGRRI
mgnify:CR=1 FL=1